MIELFVYVNWQFIWLKLYYFIWGHHILQQIKNNKNYPRYAMGQKYCSQCAIFIEWDRFHCTCCNLLLKTRSRHSKYKTEVKRIDWVSRPRNRDNSLHWSKKSQTKIIQINTLFWQVIMACNDQLTNTMQQSRLAGWDTVTVKSIAVLVSCSWDGAA